MGNHDSVRWGVIGAGDVVIRKSGAPLRDLEGSLWHGLYRRNREQARRIARDFSVPRVYDDPREMLEDPEISAVYIATPPSSHAGYAIDALEAGKDVYLEKPMACSYAGARKIGDAVDRTGGRLVMAHYRRALPAFEAVGRMLEEGAIGTPRFAGIRIIQPGGDADTGTGLAAKNEGESWRLDPAVSGGGLFHDLAPHQLDLCLQWFGAVKSLSGVSRRLLPGDGADDYVAGHIEFGSGMLLDGIWCFASDHTLRSADEFEIYGSGGRISFSFFGEKVVLEKGERVENLSFNLPRWYQEPMIRRTVDYFLGRGGNPCPPEAGMETMRIIDALSGNPVQSNVNGGNIIL